MAYTGRPSKYDPKYDDLIIEIMKSGASVIEFAAEIDVNVDTIHEWAKEYPSFSVAKKIAMQKCQAWWESTGRKGLYGNKDNQFNAAVWIFNMRNRFGWRNETSEEMREKAEATAKAMAAAIKPADPIDVIKSALTDPFMKDKLKDLIKEL